VSAPKPDIFLRGYVRSSEVTDRKRGRIPLDPPASPHLPVDLPVTLHRTNPWPTSDRLPEVVYFRVVTHLHVVITVPLNIRSEETEELANALAKLTGETKTEAVTQALRERLQRVRRARAKRRLADELD
jgi:hypothetical protein